MKCSTVSVSGDGWVKRPPSKSSTFRGPEIGKVGLSSEFMFECPEKGMTHAFPSAGSSKHPFHRLAQAQQSPHHLPGGLRDDSTGVHSFMFMLRRGAMVNDSTHTVMSNQSTDFFIMVSVYLSCLFHFWQIYLTTWWCQRLGVDLVERSTH